MAAVYILYSKKLDKFYTGSCKDLNNRLIEHNNKSFKDAFTNRADDWIIYYKCEDLEYQTARKIEVHIKNMKSRVYFSNLLKHDEIMDKLIDKYSAGSCR